MTDKVELPELSPTDSSESDDAALVPNPATIR